MNAPMSVVSAVATLALIGTAAGCVFEEEVPLADLGELGVRMTTHVQPASARGWAFSDPGVFIYLGTAGIGQRRGACIKLDERLKIEVIPSGEAEPLMTSGLNPDVGIGPAGLHCDSGEYLAAAGAELTAADPFAVRLDDAGGSYLVSYDAAGPPPMPTLVNGASWRSDGVVEIEFEAGAVDQVLFVPGTGGYVEHMEANDANTRFTYEAPKAEATSFEVTPIVELTPGTCPFEACGARFMHDVVVVPLP